MNKVCKSIIGLFMKYVLPKNQQLSNMDFFWVLACCPSSYFYSTKFTSYHNTVVLPSYEVMTIALPVISTIW